MSQHLVQVFDNPTFSPIRTLDVDGKIMFCGRDVATALGYANTKDALAKRCKGVAKRYSLQTPGGTQQLRFITEGDLYRLITVSAYMAEHRHDSSAKELETYFTSVIDWVSTVFSRVPDREMRGLEWGRLYEEYHHNPNDSSVVDTRVTELRGDPAVHKTSGIYEYILGCEKFSDLLDIRMFDDKVKSTTYEQQTRQAKEAGTSNCPLCAVGTNNNRTRIYTLKEMDADHVTAWSRGGTTDASNCEMLCTTHNRAKGNR